MKRGRKSHAQIVKAAETNRDLATETLLLLTRQTSEKIVALFAKVNELQLEVQEFRKEQREVARIMLRLVRQTERDVEAAVTKDYVINKNNPR